ncbi:ATP-binding protein, partial [Allorhizocola rhizosphaerae]|uniref:ATP-binding protein n=1 Tax=Allorhizocola rhizosphaerae TaxID=1872709 RepID=UPI000E3DA059
MFSALLRRHRLARRLTQEALAERAGVSSRSIGEIERGRGRSPRPQTVERLAAALELTGDERAEFVAAGRALIWEARRDEREPDPIGACQLPADLPDFVGRDEELSTLERVLTDGPRLAVVSGPPGVGKTALAVHAGHRIAERFPDGQLCVALRAGAEVSADPGEVLGDMLRALGVEGSALPSGLDARAALFRTRLSARRILLVLDDAAGHRQVEALLPAGRAAVLVTSRLPLTGLPGAVNIDLGPLDTSAAIELLCRVVGRPRVKAQHTASAEVVAACGGLPLAVRIAAAKLAARPNWTVSEFAERLANERRRLDELSYGDLAVRPGLQLAYRGLSPSAARAFGLLGGLGVPSFAAWPVALLLDTDPATGRAALEELLDARLVEGCGRDQAGQARYRLHDVTRLFARECRDAAIGHAEWEAALARVAGGWLALGRLARDHLTADSYHLDDKTIAAAMADWSAIATATGRPVGWFEAERESLGVLVSACAEAGLAGLARSLAGCSTDFFALRAYYMDWRRVTEPALEACRRTGDRRGEAAMRHGLGSCLIEIGTRDESLSSLRAARDLAEEVADPARTALVRREIGFVLSLTGQLDEAEAELRTAVRELDAVGLHATRAIALTSLAFVSRERGQSTEAVKFSRAALAVARSCGSVFAEAFASRSLAGSLMAMGRPREAERAARKAATLFERIGDPIGAGQSRRALGEAIARDPAR